MRAMMTAVELAAHKVDAHGRDYSKSDDGYGDMEQARAEGWREISGWGADGWDLGDWPYVVISHRDGTGRHEMRQTVEGDTTVYAFDNDEDRDAATDYLFLWYAASRAERYADGAPEWQVIADDPGRVALDAGLLEVPERLRGPWSHVRTAADAEQKGADA